MLKNGVSFHQPHSVNLFEVTIRVLGSLLSVHQIITEILYGDLVEDYNNEALDLAENLGIILNPLLYNVYRVCLFRISIGSGV